MTKVILRFAVAVGAVLLTAYIIPDITVDTLFTATIVAIILGLLNILVRPLLVVLTLPITIITFGLFLFVINAALIMFVASFVEGFAVTSWVAALIGSVLISLINAVGDQLLA